MRLPRRPAKNAMLEPRNMLCQAKRMMAVDMNSTRVIVIAYRCIPKR